MKGRITNDVMTEAGELLRAGAEVELTGEGHGPTHAGGVSRGEQVEIKDDRGYDLVPAWAVEKV